jgi:hypothetical protein
LQSLVWPHSRVIYFILSPLIFHSNFIYSFACLSYYIPRWKLFIQEVEKALIKGKTIDPVEMDENILLKCELPFISSKNSYPTNEIGITSIIIYDIL